MPTRTLIKNRLLKFPVAGKENLFKTSLPYIIQILIVVIGAWLNYFLVAKPAIQAQKQAQKLAEAQTAESKTRQQLLENDVRNAEKMVRLLASQLDVAAVTVDRAKMDRILMVDKVIDALKPNYTPQHDDVYRWDKHRVTGLFTITNTGSHAIKINAKVRFPESFTFITQWNGDPINVSDLKLTVSQPKLVLPGGKTNVYVDLSSDKDISSIKSLEYTIIFEMQAALEEKSETYKMLRTIYSAQYIKEETRGTATFNTNFVR